MAPHTDTHSARSSSFQLSPHVVRGLQVLTGAFAMHAGFKEPAAFHATKQEELDSNRLLFRQFKQELKSKYPGVQRRCY